MSQALLKQQANSSKNNLKLYGSLFIKNILLLEKL